MVDMIYRQHDPNGKPLDLFVTIPYSVFRGGGSLNERILLHIKHQLPEIMEIPDRYLRVDSTDGWITVCDLRSKEYLVNLEREE